MPTVRPALPLVVVLAASCALPATPGILSPGAVAGEVERVGEGVLSTAASEYNPSLSPDGRTLVFARSGPDFRDARIMVSRRTGEGWGAPERISFSDARWTDSDPTLSPDGRTLFFVSDRPAPGRDAARKDLDLWRSELRGGEWGAPEHLGSAVNSPGPELGPAFREGWLYFGSARRGGRGGLDLYRAPLVPGGFGAAESLGGEALNTAASEGDPELSPDGSALLFWSNRAGGAGGGDLYLSRRDGDAWSAPVRLEGAVGSAGLDFTPSLSPGGEWLLFASTRGAAGEAAVADLYRVRIGGRGR